MTVNDGEALPGAATTLLLGFLVSLLEGYDLQVMTVAGPFMRKELDLSPGQFGLAFSTSIAGLAIGAIFLGALADRIGRKPVLVGSLAFLAVFTMLSAYATGLNSLLAYRFCGGLGMGGVLPNIIAISASVVSAKRKTSVVTAIACSMLLGGVVVALLGFSLAASLGWRSLFQVGSHLTTTLTLCVLIFLPKVADVKKAVLAMPFRDALFGSGRAAMTIMLWLLFILTLSILSLLLGWAPALVAGKGLPPSSGFATMLAVNLGGIVGSLVIGRLCEICRARTTLLVVYAGMALSLGIFAISPSKVAAIPLAAIVGAFVLGAQMALYGLSPRFYPEQGLGSGIGAAVGAGRIGSFIGPITGGVLIGAGASGDKIALFLVPLALCAGLVMVILMAVAPAPATASSRWLNDG